MVKKKPAIVIKPKEEPETVLAVANDIEHFAVLFETGHSGVMSPSVFTDFAVRLRRAYEAMAKPDGSTITYNGRVYYFCSQSDLVKVASKVMETLVEVSNYLGDKCRPETRKQEDIDLLAKCENCIEQFDNVIAGAVETNGHDPITDPDFWKKLKHVIGVANDAASYCKRDSREYWAFCRIIGELVALMGDEHFNNP